MQKKTSKKVQILILPCYLLIMMFLIDFKVHVIFDFKTLIIVGLCITLLYMSSYKKPNISKVRLFGVQSLLTSLLASTLLFLKAMSTGVVTIELFRPIVYGLLYFILFKIVHDMKSNQEDDVDKFSDFQLTKREIMLAELVIAGKSNRQIAGTLFIAESTVKKHIQNIYRKTQTTDRQSFISLMKS